MQLPHGSPTTLNGVSETFAFHSSPETFIASRVLAFEAEHGSLVNQRPIVHAKILGRNVAVISSYAQIKHVLTLPPSQPSAGNDNDPVFVATDAYTSFMAAFYPSPNLLLSDGDSHSKMRIPWEQRIASIVPSTGQRVKDTVTSHFQSMLSREIDLYKSLKSLIWRIILPLFLNLDESDPLFEEMELLQEDLLRGQFSLVPVSVNVGFWQSPRSRGIAAKDKLRKLILERLKKVPGSCPFHDAKKEMPETEEVSNHLLLFTSSLAVKGIASLLTAFLLNLFLSERGDVRLIEEVRRLEGNDRQKLLRSIESETERLSPPIVGIMRRVTRDTVIPTGSDNDDVLIPKGWDTWLYFVGAGRDQTEFGPSANTFDPHRSMHPESHQKSMAFSMGSKRCLGQDLVRDICMAIANTMLDNGMKLEGEISAAGVRAWLGWEVSEDVGPAEWAKDMKQLPTQRPARPVMVGVEVFGR